MVTARKTCFQVLELMPEGHEFSGGELQRKVNLIVNANHYVSTYLRYLRIYRQKAGKVVLVSKAKSQYKKIKG